MHLYIKKVLITTAFTLGVSSLGMAQSLIMEQKSVVQEANQDNEDAQLGLSRSYSSCMDKAGGVTVEMLNCMGSETEHQDALLNQAYRDVMAELSPERKTELRNAQRAWIKYRDLNCEFYADPYGGTMASLQSSRCFMDMTASRARELESFL